ncbi:hypothetical protein E4T44_07913 [Aureobasidium sp. EXF-8845]|nr:hypothetical protein E4T44_07913 [Aureobasidium sp. EXF-8845]KAI4845161.1 hypothetical protein E4T45_07832 [Aureobasidium sp. EXF-8846]
MNFILPIRIVQVILAILVLATSAYVASVYRNGSPSEINFLIFTSLWTLLALIYLTLTSWKLERFAHPWIITGVESLTMLFWFAGFIAAAVFLSDLITCAGHACSAAKAATVFAAFEWALFAVTTALAVMAVLGRGRATKAGPNTMGA